MLSSSNVIISKTGAFLRAHGAPLIIGGLCVWFFVQIVRLALFKYYSIDEFQYAHASWAMSKGQIPYRDFFDHHFPFLYQLLGLLWLFLDNNPENIRVLRGAMILVVGCTAWATWTINRRWTIDRNESRATALLSCLFLFTIEVFATRATEIRPDSLATALFLYSLAVLYSKRLAAKWRGFFSGLLFAASVWSTQKGFYFGLIFPMALAIDLYGYRKKRTYLLAHPLMFAVGTGVVCLCVGAYLTVSGSWTAWYRWCIQWAFTHQREYPGFSWLKSVIPLLKQHWWLISLSCIGIASTIKSSRNSQHADRTNPDPLVIGAFVTACYSYLNQTAPFSYSLIPIAPFLAIFGARGLVSIWNAIGAPRNADDVSGYCYRLILLLVVAIVIVKSHGIIETKIRDNNKHQHETFAKLDELLNEDDAVFDYSGSYVSRPHAYYFFYTDTLLRKKMAHQFRVDIPKAIVKNRCPAFFVDARQTKSSPIAPFLRENFQPYNGNISLWGKRFDPKKKARNEFWAIKDGKYFVSPISALRTGMLRIDGQIIGQEKLTLKAGQHRVEFEGDNRPFYILRLPRNGKSYRPQPKQPRNFSKIL